MALPLRVALLPTLPFHAGMSMQVYAASLLDAMAGQPGVTASLGVPPFASRTRVGWLRSRWIRHVTYPRWAATQRADVYHIVDHGNAQLLRGLPRARTVVTVHDLYPVALASGRLRVPGAASRLRMIPTALRLMALRGAATLVAVSGHTRDECRRYLGIPASRVRVVHESLPPVFWTPRDGREVAAMQERLGLSPDQIVVLHVGSNDPRKNVATVCEVVARLYELGGRPVALVKVGAALSPAELATLRRAGVGPDAVRQVRALATGELMRVYQSATVLLCPSFYEGFCRPVAEAMAAGLPVVASAAGAIPEIAGGAASLHDPSDAAGMAARIADIADRPALRKEMVAAGRERSRRFSPESHGPALAAVYREIAGR